MGARTPLALHLAWSTGVVSRAALALHVDVVLAAAAHSLARTSDARREPGTRRRALLPSAWMRRELLWASPARLRTRTSRVPPKARKPRVHGPAELERRPPPASAAQLSALRVPELPELAPRSARPRTVDVRVERPLATRARVHTGTGAHADERAVRATSSSERPLDLAPSAAHVRPSVQAHEPSYEAARAELRRRPAEIDAAVRARTLHVAAIKRSGAELAREGAPLAALAAPSAEGAPRSVRESEPLAVLYPRPATIAALPPPARDAGVGRELEELRGALARRVEPARVEPPRLDVGALGRQVLGEIERHVRVERERRGR